MNLPYFWIKGAKNTTCQEYDKMEKKMKRKIALYVMQFAYLNDTKDTMK